LFCGCTDLVTIFLKISASNEKMYIFADAHSLWVSASDIGHAPGQIYWADGHAVDSSLWNTGEPNIFGAGEETCAKFNMPFSSSSILCELQ